MLMTFGTKKVNARLGLVTAGRFLIWSCLVFILRAEKENGGKRRSTN